MESYTLALPARTRVYYAGWTLLYLIGIVFFSVLFNNTGSIRYNYLHLCGYLMIVGIFVIFIFHPQRRLQINLIDGGILGVLGYLLIGATLKASYEIMEILMQCALMGYYVAIRTFDWKDKYILRYYFCISLLITGMALTGLMEWLNWLESESAFFSISGFFANPTNFGGFLACGVVFLMGLVLQKQIARIYRICIAVVGIFIVGIIVLSESRAALIGLALAGIGYGYYWLRRYPKYQIWWRLGLAGILAGAVYGIMQLKSSDSVNGRWLIWKISSRMFVDNPWFGVGHNQFSKQYMQYQEQYFLAGLGSDKEIWLAGNPRFPFNECLGYLIENGCVGVGIVLIIGLLIWFKRKHFRPIPVWVGITTAMFVVVFFVFAQFSYPLHYVCFQLLVLNQLAIISSYYHSQPGKRYGIAARLIQFGGLSLILSAIYFYKGTVYWQDAYIMQYDDPERSRRLYEKAEKMLARNHYLMYDYGMLLRESDLKLSTQKLQESSETYGSYLLYENLAENYEKMQNFAAAEKMYLKSHYQMPIRLTPQYKLMQLYQKTGNTAKMKYWAKAILNTPIKVDNPKAEHIQNAAKQVLS